MDNNSSVLAILNEIDSIVWGVPLLVLLVGTGIFLTIRLNLIQVFKLPHALSLITGAKNHGAGDVSSFKALCVALSATVGTGNIVGVATAIKLGGPGALFWMWLAAFFGMATKYAEGLLAIKYRTTDSKGEVAGGPMYYIINGLGPHAKPLAYFFAIACVLVAFLGIGTFPQVNAIVDSFETTFGVSRVITDIILTILQCSFCNGPVVAPPERVFCLKREDDGGCPVDLLLAVLRQAHIRNFVIVHDKKIPPKIYLIRLKNQLSPRSLWEPVLTRDNVFSSSCILYIRTQSPLM